MVFRFVMVTLIYCTVVWPQWKLDRYLDAQEFPTLRPVAKFMKDILYVPPAFASISRTFCCEAVRRNPFYHCVGIEKYPINSFGCGAQYVVKSYAVCIHDHLAFW